MNSKIKPPTQSVILAYIPVLHHGYFQFLQKHPEATILFIFSHELISEFDYLAKEIRALDPQLVRKAIENWQVVAEVKLASLSILKQLAKTDFVIICPDEDVTHAVVEKYLANNSVQFDPIFLRWDRPKSVMKHDPENKETISSQELDRQFMTTAYDQSKKSSDWWRQVGAVLVKENKVLFQTHNTHLPSPHQPYIDGDPRNNFHKGEHIDLTTAIHAEAKLVGMAAKKGESLSGCQLYVSTFPCPPCAKLIAEAGISQLYYGEGYGMLDGVRVLTDAGVEIIKVEL